MKKRLFGGYGLTAKTIVEARQHKEGAQQAKQQQPGVAQFRTAHAGNRGGGFP